VCVIMMDLGAVGCWEVVWMFLIRTAACAPQDACETVSVCLCRQSGRRLQWPRTHNCCARTPNSSPQPHILGTAGASTKTAAERERQVPGDHSGLWPMLTPKNQQSWQPHRLAAGAACALHHDQPAALPPCFVTQPPLPLLASHFLIHPFTSLKLVVIFKSEARACK